MHGTFTNTDNNFHVQSFTVNDVLGVISSTYEIEVHNEIQRRIIIRHRVLHKERHPIVEAVASDQQEKRSSRKERKRRLLKVDIVESHSWRSESRKLRPFTKTAWVASNSDPDGVRRSRTVKNKHLVPRRRADKSIGRCSNSADRKSVV